MSSRRQKLLARVNWYLQYSLKHVTEWITGDKFYYRGGRYRQVSLYIWIYQHQTTTIHIKAWTVCIFLGVYCYGQSCTQYRFRPSGKSMPIMLLNAGMVLSMVQFTWFGKRPSIIIWPSEFEKVWGPEHSFSYCDPVISPKPSCDTFLVIWLHLSAAPACIVTTNPSRTGLNPAQWRHMATEI